ncbi:MAG: DUF366 family protein [Candidatus Margulisiibacteriota bacterium]
MNKSFLYEKVDYTGEQLSSLWIYKNAGIRGDAIVSFIGKADVRDHMVDQEDVLKNEFIYSEKMLHFLIEHFDLDLEKAVLRQRLFMVIIEEVIKEYGCDNIIRSGDDLYVGDGKLSVSIATLSPISSLIHTGLNISNKNTPVETYALLDIMKEKDLEQFAGKVMEKYIKEMEDIYLARCKVKGVN